MAARVGSLGERGNPRAEAAAHRLDEVGIVGLAEMVGIGIVELRSAQTGEGQIGAVGTEVAARDGIDIDEMAEGRARGGRKRFARARG